MVKGFIVKAGYHQVSRSCENLAIARVWYALFTSGSTPSPVRTEWKNLNTLNASADCLRPPLPLEHHLVGGNNTGPLQKIRASKALILQRVFHNHQPGPFLKARTIQYKYPEPGYAQYDAGTRDPVRPAVSTGDIRPGISAITKLSQGYLNHPRLGTRVVKG